MERTRKIPKIIEEPIVVKKEKKTVKLVEIGVKNKLRTQSTGEYHTGKSRVQKTQYTTLEQMASAMMQAGEAKMAMIENMRQSHEIDRTSVDAMDIWSNPYKEDKISAVQRGRDANKKVVKQIRDKINGSTIQTGNSPKTGPTKTNENPGGENKPNKGSDS